MSLSQIDPNVWYNVQNLASSDYLSYDQNPGPIDIVDYQTSWQFLDYSVAQGGPSSLTWLVRSQNGGLFACMEVQDNTVVLSNCSFSSTLWQYTDYVFSNQAEAWLFYNTSSGGYLQGQNSNGPPGLAANVPTTGNGDVNFGWSVISVSDINDETWSTLPWDLNPSNTADNSPTITLSPSPSGTIAMPTDSGGSPTGSDGTGPTQTDSDSSPSAVVTASNSGSTTGSDSSPAAPITTMDSGSPAATTPIVIAPPSATVSLGPNSTFFNFSYIDKDLKDLGTIGDLAAALLLPQDTDVGCQNCSGSGYWSAQAGGYNTSSTEIETLVNFLESGYINLTATDININMTLDYEMEAGYTPVDVFLSLYNISLKSVNITKDVRFDFVFEIGIPFKVILDSDVKYTAGMVVSIPGPANLNLDFGNFSQSSQNGFDSSSVTLVPFSIDHSNLTLTIITGLIFRIHCNVTADLDMVDTSADLMFDLDIPSINATAHVESSAVDSSCNTPTNGEPTFSPAIDLLFEAEAGIVAHGALEIEIEHDKNRSKKWDSDDWPVITFTKDFEPQCLYLDRLEDTFLGNTAGKTEFSRWLWLPVSAASLIFLL